MIKSEIFASVLRDVCEVTGISERDIMSKSKSEEIVDARHLSRCRIFFLIFFD